MNPKTMIIFTLLIICAVIIVAVTSFSKFSPTISSKQNESKYICPKTEYVDCMPTVNRGTEQEKNCSKEYLNWAQDNCPNFKGAAY